MLIKTKLITAPLKSRMLFRKTLIGRLSAAKAYPLILISAPAGSGKTSLACQWIAQSKPTVAWYSLDEEDNDPDLFFRYLLTTIAGADERLNEIFSPMLENQRVLAYENVIPELIASMSNLPRDIHIILDDFHLIANDQIHDDLARLLQYMPARLHFVILSRYDLPAPIDAVSLKQERLVIAASDLQFTEKEAAALYKEVIPLSLSPAQIHDLNRHMEGWAAGLQLIGLSIKSQGQHLDLSNILNQAHDQVANYLIHDILRKLPDKIRSFIFTTALLDRFDPELCAEITGMPDAALILEDLEHMNLFLIPLDTRRKWYRYHHMFSEVIRRQVAILDADPVRETLRKAALWSARNRHLEDALRCAFRSNDIEFAADLVEDIIMGYVETFDLAAGLRWIQKLPESELNQRPLLRLQQCGFLSILMELADVKEILTILEKDGEPDFSRYSGDKLKFCQDLIAYFKCMLNILYAGETASLTQLQVLRDDISLQNPLFTGYIDTHIVSILISKGDLPPAESYLDRLAKVAVHTRDRLMKKKVYHAHARVLIARHQGRLRTAEEIIQQVLQFFNQQGCDQIPMAFLLHRHLGNICYLQNRLEEARRYAANAVKHCEYFGLTDEIMSGNELWLQLHLAADEKEQALKSIHKIEAYAIRLGMPRIAASAEACAARMAIDQGNLTAAGMWSQQRKVQPDEPFSLLYAMEGLTQARFLYARGRYTEAVHLLEILRHRCIKRTLAELVLRINILQSAALFALNHQTTAASLLVEALAFSEIEGYIRPFVNNAKLLAPVLRHIAIEKPSGLSSEHFDKIMIACDIYYKGTPAAAGFNSGEHEGLTQREIEILGWIAQGFQNKEISQKCYISITTVKSHVSSILVKLNVKTRTQAILKAKEMNILEIK